MEKSEYKRKGDKKYFSICALILGAQSNIGGPISIPNHDKHKQHRVTIIELPKLMNNIQNNIKVKQNQITVIDLNKA